MLELFKKLIPSKSEEKPSQPQQTKPSDVIDIPNPMTFRHEGIWGCKPECSMLENLVRNQLFSYTFIYLRQKDFDTPKFHYDWWLFPVEAPKGQWSDVSDYYSLTPQNTLDLLGDVEFMKRFSHSVELYLQAQLKRWNQYDVRFGKVLLSLMHFIGTSDHYDEFFDNNIRLRELATLASSIANTIVLPIFHAKKPNEEFPYNAIERLNGFLHSQKSAEHIQALKDPSKLKPYLSDVEKRLVNANHQKTDQQLVLKTIQPFLNQLVNNGIEGDITQLKRNVDQTLDSFKKK